MVEPKEDEAMTFTESVKRNVGNDFSNYQHMAKATAIYPAEHGLVYLTLGLFGEAGELANKIKKIIRGDYENKGTATHNLVADSLIDECGDIAWYLSQLLLLCNKDLGDILKYDVFDDYASEIRAGFDDENEDLETHALRIGGLVGELCEMTDKIFVVDDVAFITGKAELIVESICIITLILERPFSSVFDRNLEKLSKRKQDNTLKGDSRGEGI